MTLTSRLLTLAALSAVWSSGAFAEEAKPAAAPAAAEKPAVAAVASKSQIAVLNVEQIMRESLAAKSIKEQVDKKQKAFRDELSAKESALQKEEQELTKQRSVLAQDAFEKKVKEFRERANAAQREIGSKRESLNKAVSGAVGEIQKNVSAILGAMAKERGYTVVIPMQQIVYNDASLDITADVMKQLNAKLPKVTVNFK